MSAPLEITAEWLVQPMEGIHPIPADHLAIFRDEWGESAELTRANLYRAAERGLHPAWLAARLLAPSDLERYRAALRPAMIEAARSAGIHHRAIRPPEERRVEASVLADALGL